MTYIHPLCYKCCLHILHFVDFCQKCGHIGWRFGLWDKILKEDHPCKVWLNLTEGFRKDFYCESQVNVHISDKNQQNVKCVGNTYNTGGEYTS
jgi:hypothetical protein